MKRILQILKEKIPIATIICGVFFGTICSLLSFNLNVTKLDMFVDKINSVYVHNYYNSFVSPYLNVCKKDNNDTATYNDLFEHFYYYNMSSGCRQTIDNKVTVSKLDKEIKLIHQPTYSIKTETNAAGLYSVDYNMFSAYYSPEFFKDFSYLTPRFGCDTFVFISDTLAQKLVSFYNITGNNSFSELILKKEYSILNLDIHNNGKKIKASINNVISSSYKSGLDVQNTYGDFALFYYRKPLQSILNSSFDIEFKVNQYGNKAILLDLDKLGYNSENSFFSFFSYDYANKKYFKNNTLTDEFLDLSFDSDTLLLSLFYVFIIIGICFMGWLSYFLSNNKKTAIINVVSYLSLFLAYGLVTIFLNVPPYFSIFPVFSFLIVIIFSFVGFKKHKHLYEKNNSNVEILI